MASPPGGSTLTTSAPMPANRRPQYGTAAFWANSTTRIPSSTPAPTTGVEASEPMEVTGLHPRRAC